MSPTAAAVALVPDDTTEDEMEEVNAVGIHHFVANITSAAVNECRIEDKPEWIDNDIVEICAYDADDEELAFDESPVGHDDGFHSFGGDRFSEGPLANSTHAVFCDCVGELPEDHFKTIGREERIVDSTHTAFHDFVVGLPENYSKTMAREDLCAAPSRSTAVAASMDDVWTEEDMESMVSAGCSACGCEGEPIDFPCVGWTRSLSGEVGGACDITGLCMRPSGKRVLTPDEAAVLLQHSWRARTVHLAARRSPVRPSFLSAVSLAAPIAFAPPAGPKPNSPCRRHLGERPSDAVHPPGKLMEPQARRQVCRLVAESAHYGDHTLFKLEDDAGVCANPHVSGKAWDVSTIEACYTAFEKDGDGRKARALRPLTSRARADVSRAIKLEGMLNAPAAHRILAPRPPPPTSGASASAAQRARRAAAPSATGTTAACSAPSAMELDLDVELPPRPRVMSSCTRKTEAGFLPKLPVKARAVGKANWSAGAPGLARPSMQIF